jgi:hypothetical protein
MMITALLFLNLTFAATPQPKLSLPDLEASSLSYPAELKGPMTFSSDPEEPNQEWTQVLQTGPRNLQWLALLNANRAPADKIQLVVPGSAVGIPIEDPIKYNDLLLSRRWKLIQKDIPEALKNILLTNVALPTTLPVDLETYKVWAKKIDSLYSLGIRWRGMKTNIPYFREQRVYDFRGLHYLTKMDATDLKNKLANFDSLSVDDQKNLQEWTTQVCTNAVLHRDVCEQEFINSKADHKLNEWLQSHLADSQKAYDSFFAVAVKRTDMTVAGTDLHIPFHPHNEDRVTQFVKSNVEDEWKWLQGRLILDLNQSALVNIQLMPGVVPHVNDVAGNNITLNSEIALDSWDAQYTIRHEFGHVLGFLDCYIEFWDDAEQAFISYQFDLTNIMCSRAGRFNQRNASELKSAYGLAQ